MRSARRHAAITCSEPGVLMLPASAGVLVPLHAGREDVRPRGDPEGRRSLELEQ
jgi:hypothetical protein